MKHQEPIKEFVLSRSKCLKITLFLEFLVCVCLNYQLKCFQNKNNIHRQRYLPGLRPCLYNQSQFITSDEVVAATP